MTVPKPFWTTWSFLLYLGGFTVLGSAIGGLAYLSSQYGKGAFVGWTLLPLVVLIAIAIAFERRGEWMAAGLFAFAAIAMWIAFTGSLLDWWGWLPDDQSNPLKGWHWGTWLFAVLIIVGSMAALRRFRFPLIVLYVLNTSYFLAVDILSNGGGWSAVVTLVIGLVYFLIGVVVDRGPRRAYGFWIHLTAAITILAALVYWWHSSEADYALLTVTGLVYIGIAAATERSVWAVLGAAAIFASAAHWANEWTNVGFSIFAPNRNWVPPVVFAVVGFAFVLIGLMIERRRRTAV
jgi:hypothetical protein